MRGLSTIRALYDRWDHRGPKKRDTGDKRAFSAEVTSKRTPEGLKALARQRGRCSRTENSKSGSQAEVST